MRHRREKRAVGFDQQPVDRDHLRDFLQLQRARKRNDAGQRDVKPDIENALRHRAIAGETVKHTADVSRPLFVQDAKRIVLRFPGVNDDREPAALRQANLLAKDLLLDLTRREIVVVIKTDFAAGPRQRLPGDDGIDGFRRIGRILSEPSRRVRVHANGEPDRLPCLRDPLPLCDFRSVVCGEDDKGVCQLRMPRMLDDRGEILNELGPGDMTVGIDHGKSQDPNPNPQIPKQSLGIGIWTLGFGV